MKIVTRIFIAEDGDLIVTDLWDEIEDLLKEAPESSFEITHQNL